MCLRRISSPRLAFFSFSYFILLTNVYLQIVYAQKKARDTLQNDMSQASDKVFFSCFLFYSIYLQILFAGRACTITIPYTGLQHMYSTLPSPT